MKKPSVGYHMASYHLSVKIISRSSGRSGIAAAAYRARTKIYDERQGLCFDYSKKVGFINSEIMAPENSPPWVHDRARLWNAVEASEKRKDAQIAREVEVALPKELSLKKQIKLVKDFAHQKFVNAGMIADINTHFDNNNPHAHIMLTMREITPNGFGAKERSWNKKHQIEKWRKEWAELQNVYLAREGLDIRVDNRSFSAMGIELEPQIKIGPVKHETAKDESIKELDRYEKFKQIMITNGNTIISDPKIAIDHLTYHQSTFSEEELLKYINSHSWEKEQFDGCREAITKCSELIRLGDDKSGKKRYTSRTLLDLETSINENTDKLKTQNNHRVNDDIKIQAIANRTMTADQLSAFQHMVAGGDIAVVTGKAGSGKSYTLGAVREAYEAQGYRVQGIALSGIAAEGLQNSSGIESGTVHKKIWEWEKGRNRLNDQTVLVVDEAGMVGTRQMAEIVNQVTQSGSKLIVVGDEQQLQAIEAGAAFRAIKQRVGAVSMDDVMRQKVAWQKEATKFFAGAEPEISQALDLYIAHGNIRSTASFDNAKWLLLKDWSENYQTEKSSLILAHRNQDVGELNQAARNILKQKGLIGKRDHRIETETGKVDLSKNDRVMFLKNENSIGIKNGSIGTVEKVKRGVIRVELNDGRRVAVDTNFYKDLTYGYAATVHKSQGATLDNTYVLATRGFDKHLAYVTMSRHREDVRLYYSKDKEGFKNTDALKAAFARKTEKDLILDYDQIENALKKLTYHHATFDRQEIINYLAAHKSDYFKFSTEDILNHPHIIILENKGDITYTTKSMFETERRLFSDVTDINHKTQHVLPEQTIETAVNQRSMNDGQLKAFQHMVAGGDIAAVTGKAGTGKSYTLGAVREAYEAQGYRVQGIALSGIAAEGLKNSSGIESTTIHKKLWEWENARNRLDNQTVLVVDEAGMVGTRKMAEIVSHVKESGSKLIVVGDDQQLQAVEAGAAFRGIQDRVGAVSMDDVIRQKVAWQKQATKLFSGTEPEISRALDLYQSHGNIHSTASFKDAKRLLIKDWSENYQAGKSSLILAHRNQDVTELNQTARETLIRSGRLVDAEIQIKAKWGTIDVSLNDRLIFLSNDHSIGVKNGSLATVKKIDRGQGYVALELDDRCITLDTKKYYDMSHGYAATIHKSQGSTLDNTYVLATRGFDKHLAYVSMSRHREDVRLYRSSDKEEGFKSIDQLKEVLSRPRDKDLVGDYEKRLTHYQIVVTCSGTEYRESIVVGPEVKDRLWFLETKAKGFAAKVAAKHRVKNAAELHVSIKRKEPEKRVSLKKDIGLER